MVVNLPPPPLDGGEDDTPSVIMTMVSTLPVSLRDQRRITTSSTQPRVGKQEIVDLVGQQLHVHTWRRAPPERMAHLTTGGRRRVRRTRSVRHAAPPTSTVNCAPHSGHRVSANVPPGSLSRMYRSCRYAKSAENRPSTIAGDTGRIDSSRVTTRYNSRIPRNS